MIESGDLAGRVVLVTGGTRGIGAAVSCAMVAAGAEVHALYRSDADAAQSLATRLGTSLSVHPCDVRAPDVAASVVGRILSRSGRLDALVNCAGGSTDRLLLRATPEYIADTLALNLTSVMHMTRLAIQPMLKQRFGRIVNLSSAVAGMGNAGQSVYAAAKAGVEGFTRSLAREVGAKGVTVNCVSPGWIDTDLTSQAGEGARERAIAATPAGRVGTADEVADAVLYLASPRAGFITGTVLQVGGGLYM